MDPFSMDLHAKFYYKKGSGGGGKVGVAERVWTPSGS